MQSSLKVKINQRESSAKLTDCDLWALYLMKLNQTRLKEHDPDQNKIQFR